jgi:hypothetical protein
MSGSRQRMALGAPRGNLSGFPRSRLLHRDVLYRAHAPKNSPWWFSSNMKGRFDLLPPHGTCYLATDMTSALRERFGHDLVRQGYVTFQAAADTHLSKLQVPSTRFLAKTCAPESADFGMTREIGTCAVYKIPQAWAKAFFASGKYSGIRYQSRFAPGAKSNSVALFDSAGQQGWPTDPHATPGVKACDDVGIKVLHPPTRKQVRIVQPPD